MRGMKSKARSLGRPGTMAEKAADKLEQEQAGRSRAIASLSAACAHWG